MSNCLLIVDVQQGFVNAHSAHVPERVACLQHEYARVYATRFFNPPASLHRRLIGWQRMAHGSDEWALAFAPRVDCLIIDKCIYTCVSPGFVAELRGNGIDRVDICGIDTDICVTKCAVDLFEHGIVPRVLANACGSHAGSDAHERGLQVLERFIGRRQVVR